MGAKPSMNKHLFKIHAAGVAVCALIAGASVYFASKSISNQRGHYFNAQHMLAAAKGDLNEAVTQRMRLTTQVQHLQAQTADDLKLVSIKELNSRTAQIVELAESVGVRVDSLQPRDLITDKQVPVEPLEMKAQAQAADLFVLLGLMNEQMADIHIQSIDILNNSADSSEVLISMTLYWFVSPADES